MLRISGIRKPNTLDLSMRSQVVNVPVGPRGRLAVMGDPGAQGTRTQRAPQVNVIAALKLHHPQEPDLNPGITRAKKVSTRMFQASAQ